MKSAFSKDRTARVSKVTHTGVSDAVQAAAERANVSAATRLRVYMASCGVLRSELGQFGATGALAELAASLPQPYLSAKSAGTCRQLAVSQLLAAASLHRQHAPPLSLRAPPACTTPVIGDRTTLLQAATRASGWRTLQGLKPDLPLTEIIARLWAFLQRVPAWGNKYVRDTSAVKTVLTVAATLASRWAVGGSGAEWEKRSPGKRVTYVDGSKPGIQTTGKASRRRRGSLITQLNGQAATAEALAAAGIDRRGNSTGRGGRGIMVEAGEGQAMATRHPGVSAASSAGGLQAGDNADGDKGSAGEASVSAPAAAASAHGTEPGAESPGSGAAQVESSVGYLPMHLRTRISLAVTGVTGESEHAAIADALELCSHVLRRLCWSKMGIDLARAAVSRQPELVRALLLPSLQPASRKWAARVVSLTASTSGTPRWLDRLSSESALAAAVTTVFETLASAGDQVSKSLGSSSLARVKQFSADVALCDAFAFRRMMAAVAAARPSVSDRAELGGRDWSSSPLLKLGLLPDLSPCVTALHLFEVAGATAMQHISAEMSGATGSSRSDGEDEDDDAPPVLRSAEAAIISQSAVAISRAADGSAERHVAALRGASLLVGVVDQVQMQASSALVATSDAVAAAAVRCIAAIMNLG